MTRNHTKSLAQMRILFDTLLTGLHDRLPSARIVVPSDHCLGLPKLLEYWRQ